MVIEDKIEKENESNEDGTCAYLHCNKNCIMKLSMHHTGKRVKQEIQIGRIKKKHGLLEEKVKKDFEGKKGTLSQESYFENGHETLDDQNNKNLTEKDSTNWKRKHCAMCAEKDACMQKHLELEKY